MMLSVNPAAFWNSGCIEREVTTRRGQGQTEIVFFRSQFSLFPPVQRIQHIDFQRVTTNVLFGHGKNLQTISRGVAITGAARSNELKTSVMAWWSMERRCASLVSRTPQSSSANGFMPVKQFCGTLTQTMSCRAGQLVHRRPMLFHRDSAARFSFKDGFGSFHATDIALPRMKVNSASVVSSLRLCAVATLRWKVLFNCAPCSRRDQSSRASEEGGGVLTRAAFAAS